jgi:hypothetical protein
VEQGDRWERLIAAAGAVGAAVAVLYVIGGASLSLRYQGFELPGQVTAAQTPPEVLLAAGLRTLAIWTLVGVALVLSLRWLPDATGRAVARALRRPAGILAAAAVALVLLMVLRVWWPLAAYAAVLAIVLTSVVWKERPVPRVVAAVAAIALVGVAYEADRLSFYVERTCVTLARGARSVDETRPTVDRPMCGTLVGQHDRGFYLGVPVPAPEEHSKPQKLVFIPAARVRQARSDKRVVRVTRATAANRRARLVSRLGDIRVR